MVTEKQYAKDGVYYGAVVLFGTHSDSKPVSYGNGSVFVEVDTGKVFQFDAENTTWYQMQNGLVQKVNEIEQKLNDITYYFASGVIEQSPQKIGEVTAGNWVCSVLYPMNMDITVAVNQDNEIIAASANYTGAVIALCFKV